ncbi:hypothetical protein K9O30_21195 [Clostridium bowmanii]|uniref:hypothetical protein n=1 Tax=Clostridium bowmanii TaxID=132925 RepID=UPI001C0BE993|nr:hypothetical protein [Clostridium bowmanii]MBU3191912.1 hypothetical protein [Clostridium bowmanii]MCA1076191.1 hypothetical protein [Clostridium bowmanii]
MNYLDELLSNINSRQRKQRINSNKNLIGLAILGVTIVGTVSVLLTRKFGEEIRNIIISNAKDSEYDINEDVDLDIGEDADIDNDEDPDEDIEEEIKQTLEKQRGKSIGDVGAAMEEALDDLKDEEKNYNEAKD